MRARSIDRLLACALLAASLWAAKPVAALEPVGEKIEIASRFYEGILELLVGRAVYDDKFVGYLSVPPDPTGRLPAVVIEPDSLGLSDDEFDYARALNAAGYVTLVLDEYADRRVRNREDPYNWTRAGDALFALRTLARHARVDPRRIAVVGFSRGGHAAYLSALEPVRRGVLGTPNTPRFAAHAAFYPNAPALVIGPQVYTGAPVRFFLGREDTVAPPTPWLDHFNFLQANNAAAPFQHALYDGGHGFERSYPRRMERSVVSSGRCPPNYYRVIPGRGTVELYRMTAGKLVSMTRDQLAHTSCVALSGQIGRTSEVARTQARADLLEFLAKSMPAN